MTNFIKILFLLVFFSMSIPNDSDSDIEISDKNVETAQKLGFIPGAGQFYNEDYLKILSKDILKQIKKNEAGWEDKVPKAVSDMIIKNKMFGFK